MSKNRKRPTEVQRQLKWAAVALFGLPSVAFVMLTLSAWIHAVTGYDIFAPTVEAIVSVMGKSN